MGNSEDREQNWIRFFNQLHVIWVIHSVGS